VLPKQNKTSQQCGFAVFPINEMTIISASFFYLRQVFAVPGFHRLRLDLSVHPLSFKNNLCFEHSVILGCSLCSPFFHIFPGAERTHMDKK